MRFLFTVSILIVFSSAALGQLDKINVIPKPNSVTAASGNFLLNEKTVIVAEKPAEKSSARLLAETLRNIGMRNKVVSKRPARNFIEFIPAQDKEGEYAINVDPNRITIEGSGSGQFYAVQTISQILPMTAKNATIPCGKIVDSPRFRYRGMHLDVGRHFQPVSFVKKFIDLMSQYKFNYFHWHLTEDQGWRIEIKKYPRLTEIGSNRPETMKDKNRTPYIGDGIPHGGFYTQAQIKDVVAYAKSRQVTVIPEIELPGHASAALAAYPQFGCKTDYKYQVQTTWGIFKEVFCPTEETFTFLEDVLDETISLFPDSPYIHIGGDEVLKDHWKESSSVQELKRRENLKDEHEVQSYFIRRIERFINSKGKKMIGWDEILEGGLAPNATVMSWRGMRGGIEAAKSKHDVIMTPMEFAYFDYGQGDPNYEPLNIGNHLPMDKVYSFEPVPKELNENEAKYVIGAQGNIWTEFIKTPENIEYMAVPRMLALAEVVWSRKQDRDLSGFSRRLAAQLPRLDRQNVSYRIPEPDGLRNVVTSDERVSVELKPAIGTRVHFTTDGSTPTERSPLYSSPIDVQLRPGALVTVKTVVVNSVGRQSSIYAATIVHDRFLESVDQIERKSGVKFELSVPAGGFVKSGETSSIQLQQLENQIDTNNPYTISFDGFVGVSADGLYEFQVDSTWGVSLSVAGRSLIDDPGTAQKSTRFAIIPLKAGMHRFSYRYEHRGGPGDLTLRMGLKGQGLRRIYGGELFH